MDYNSTRSFTMTLAHRAVGDIRRGGFRQLRNYVDMIYGASELKKKADADGQPISWVTAARCGDERLAEMIPEAAKHGSYVWLLDALSTDPAQVVPLAKANPQTAFGLLADPAALTEDCVAALAACRNLVVMPLLNRPPYEGTEHVLRPDRSGR